MQYVVSDIHGHYNEFIALLRQIKFKMTDTLYVLGDAIDRGPEPIKCLDYIMEHKNVHMLLGNHELMMYDALQYNSSEDRRLWYDNGGAISETKFAELPGPLQEDILNFIAKLPLNIEVDANGTDYLLCHAAPLQKYYNTTFTSSLFKYRYFDEKEYAVWHRGLVKPIDNKTIIIGHTPTIYYQNLDKAEIYKLNNTVIDIDCGAAYPEYGGRLCCFCLDTQKTYYQDIQ